MNFINNQSYFVAPKSVVLRKEPKSNSEALNHLIYGDWMRFLGEENNGWAKIHSRGNYGWIPKNAVQEERILEINFVDIGIGDGCHIVTPEDEIIIIDAGQTDNMARFINWRYNIRNRDVVGVDGVTSNDPNTKPPMEIDHVVISHPDKDHYYGLKYLFDNKKLTFKNVYHNGILERPKDLANQDLGLKYYSSEDLGGYATSNNKKFLWDTVNTNVEMHNLIKRYKTSTKDYLETLKALVSNNPNVKFTTLSINDKFFANFDDSNPLKIEVLGPVTEKVSYDGKNKQCLIRLKDEGKTKNGHSVIFKLQLDKLKVFLGGDLNTQSEDYLLKYYTETKKEVSELEHEMTELLSKGKNINADEEQELLECQAEINTIITKGRKFFQVDIAKACHHGSHHFSETFLRCLNSIASVISSGDGDSYAHPRPDALGAFGKYGRGERPLIFSTEIGRSTNEFTYVKEYIKEILAFDEAIKNAPTEREKNEIQKEMEKRKDSNVATYGMITVRTNGDKTYLMQKLEKPRKKSEKWDIHELRFNNNTEQFEYVEKLH
ncbi:MAG: MBL fold metallo-hydrolase [Winogradskyella sp.]|nr:MBL fold metallo-hydrolase [Winogradskyella sp.]